MGCVYIPPENSLYSSINAFLDIENEIVNFIEKDMKCALVGDFNAKTAVLEDFSEPDETFLNVMDVNVEDGLFRYHIAMCAVIKPTIRRIAPLFMFLSCTIFSFPFTKFSLDFGRKHMYSKSNVHRQM